MATRFGRYEIVRLLGMGGFGSVFEAVLVGPGGMRKPVALKVLDAGGGLAREARIGGLLRHRNLVDVFEVGEKDGRGFCAMELCRGGTLAKLGRLPPRAVVDVGLQVCEALRYAHDELDLVHLDIKPENLLLDGATVKVGDLGLARADGFQTPKAIVGTPGFMAPEQLRGEAVDARADVYALGVTLAVLATGEIPRPSATYALTRAEGLPVRIGDDRPPTPEWLAPVLDRCLCADAVNRFASMVELARALRQLVVDGPDLAAFLGVTAAPEGTGEGQAGAGGVFVGRAAEMATLADLLAEPGLVTIKGPAGIGKSRLATEAARAWAAVTGRPSWHVSLTASRSLGELLQTVAACLDTPVHRDAEEAVGTLGYALRARGDAVLILDDFEQLRPEAGVIARWLALAPRLRAVVTSRESLRIAEERLFGIDVLSEADAVALLRARALDRGVEVGEDPALTEIARRLDAVPLALELAAGRLGVLTPADLLERLGLSLLRSARADLSDRQSTLRGALDWSWGLLGAAERETLAQLSVFRGGFLLEAAERVVLLELDAPWVVDVIGSLVERSLVRRVGPSRFDLLASVREYAAEQLPGRDTEVRHGAWAASLADDPTATRTPALRQRLVSETDNLVAACRAAIARGDVGIAADTCDAVSLAVEHTGPATLASQLAGAALAVPGATLLQQARLEMVIARAAQLAGDLRRAEPGYRQSLELAHAAGARLLEARVLTRLGVTLSDLKRQEEGEEAIRRSIAIHTDLGNRHALGTALQNLGYVLQVRDPAGAVQVLEQSLAIHREEGARQSEAFVLSSLAFQWANHGDWAATISLYEQALAAHREVGNRRGASSVLTNIGNACLTLGRVAEARAAYDAALADAEQVGDMRLASLALGQIGLLRGRAGDLTGAIELLEQAVARSREALNPRGEATTLVNLAEIAYELGLPNARQRLDEALAVCRRHGLARFEGAALGAVARIAIDEGRLDEAETTLAAAFAIARAGGDAWMEGTLLGEEGRLRLRRRDHPGAAAALARGEALLRGVGAPLETAVLLCGRAELEAARGDSSAAATLAEAEVLAASAGASAMLGRRLAAARGTAPGVAGFGARRG